MVYRSKISWVPAIIIFTTLAGSCVSVIYNGKYNGILVFILPIAIAIHSYKTTNYSIDGFELKIKSGFFIRKVNINSIRKITEVYGILTAPALSLKRIEIFYNTHNSIEISPDKKENFIAHLQSINPAIEYQPKNKK